MPRKSAEAAAPSLGAAILAPAVTGTEPEVAAEATPAPVELEAVVTDSAAEPPVEELAPIKVDPTDYSALQAERRVAPAARQRSSNVPTVDESAPAVTLTMVTCEIERDMSTKIEKTVFEHELPALYAVFTYDNVKLKEGSQKQVQLDHFSPVDELMRLQQRYDRRNLDVISKAYPRGAYDIAELAGVKPEAMRSAQQKLSQQKIRSREGQVLRNRT
jgi:hypothetical protein